LPTVKVTIGEVRVLRARTSAAINRVQTGSGNIPPDWRALIERLLQFRQLRGIPIRLLQLDNLIDAVRRADGALEHGCGGGVFLTLSRPYRDGGETVERVTKGVSRVEN
jgi:hypothetical protein